MKTTNYARALEYCSDAERYLKLLTAGCPKLLKARPNTFSSMERKNSYLRDTITNQMKKEGVSIRGETKATQSPEVSRFAALYAGAYHDFTCSKDTNAGKGLTSPWLTLRGANGKEWAIRYKVALLNQNSGNGGLATDDSQDLTGTKMNVRFNSTGEPISIKNTTNGNHCEVIDWKVSGYGW